VCPYGENPITATVMSPTVVQAISLRRPTEPAFSVCFICRNESPLVYVTREAHARNRKGLDADLFETYARTKRIDDVIAQLASLMPG
jgi:hypothetical protein